MMPEQATSRIELEPQGENGPRERQRPEEAPEILPQQVGFWSTMAGCTTFFVGSCLFVSWGIVGPSCFVGLAFNAPD